MQAIVLYITEAAARIERQPRTKHQQCIDSHLQHIEKLQRIFIKTKL